MSTRDENLKKINEELEKLDDEQLEKVAGGSWIEDCIAMPDNSPKSAEKPPPLGVG